MILRELFKNLSDEEYENLINLIKSVKRDPELIPQSEDLEDLLRRSIELVKAKKAQDQNV
jgi:hypothetical protein